MSAIIIVLLLFWALAVGYVSAAVLGNKMNADLRDTIAARDKDADGFKDRITNLRAEIDAKDRSLGRANADIARLTPLAEHGQKMKDAQRRASEASAAAQAAKKASNVTSIAGTKPAKFTPPRKAHPKRRAKA